MANIWQDAVITNKGIALLTKLVEGTSLNITRAAIGTGTVAVASLMQQTEVSGSMMELLFLHFTYPEQGKVKLPVSMSNDNVDTGFVGKQIGLYASDPDEGEILFLIAQANQFTEVNGVSIPSKTEQPGFSAQWDFVFEYGQTDGITVVVDPAAALTRDVADTLYVSPSTLSEALASKADLGNDGKIPESQLPGMNYIPTSEKGSASGVAELDSAGKVPESQLPDMDYIPTSEKGAASGVAELDESKKVPVAQLPIGSTSQYGALKAKEGNGLVLVDGVLSFQLTEVVTPAQEGTLTYTGAEQSPSWGGYDTDKMILSGTTSATDAGTYTAVFSLLAAYKWEDGSTGSKSVTWTIGKATGSLSINPTSLSIIGAVGTTGTIAVT